MPDDLPIRIRRFVKEECAHGKASVTEHGTGESTEGARSGERRDTRLVEQVARPTASRLGERSNAIAELCNRGGVGDGISNCPSRRGDRLLKGKKFFQCRKVNPSASFMNPPANATPLLSTRTRRRPHRVVPPQTTRQSRYSLEQMTHCRFSIGAIVRLAVFRARHSNLPSTQPRRAASIVAMSIFCISIIASNARLAAAGSGSVIACVNAIGVICQDNPHLSLHHPHALS